LFTSHAGSVHTLNFSRFVCFLCVWSLNDTPYSKSVRRFEEMNKKLAPRNTTVQLLILYNDPERHNVQSYRQTDDIMTPNSTIR